jgi:antitoxin (DNA-binding transcriptional repressor) of toxin-antitoxin stability system
MRTATVREFRDRATSFLKQVEPIIVTRHGKIVGFFLPAAGETLPLDIKKELFATLTDQIRAMMKERGLTEETVLADFDKTRKARRRR